MEVSIVPVEYIEQVWPSIEGYLEGAANYSYGRYSVKDIKNGLLTKPQSLWIAFEDSKILGVVITSITYYPSMTALDMVFTGGIELKRWKKPMLNILQKYAKDNGCKIIESYGRVGWEKVFKQDGFKRRFMFYELPVES
jgi:hypothetical protein